MPWTPPNQKGSRKSERGGGGAGAQERSWNDGGRGWGDVETGTGSAGDLWRPAEARTAFLEGSGWELCWPMSRRVTLRLRGYHPGPPPAPPGAMNHEDPVTTKLPVKNRPAGKSWSANLLIFFYPCSIHVGFLAFRVMRSEVKKFVFFSATKLGFT